MPENSVLLEDHSGFYQGELAVPAYNTIQSEGLTIIRKIK